MLEEQNPMTGFRTLEQAFSQGFRMKRVPFTDDIFIEKDIALGAERYTYACLKKLKVQQIVVLNGNQPLNDLPCFCLFYGTLEELRGKGLTVSFIEKILEQFKKDLHKRYGKEYYIEALIETDNEASLAIAAKLFGEPSHDGVDERSGVPTRVWQYKVTR
ncbi:hypothetical protein [Pseudoalteromonas sp. MelDa3]|uniref:hypothetical protein n=1 Tax=Pseudoalteromonas sp. MelDa3 TaxID=888435 RepID=UPI000CB50FBB|nr:hypothetical protein [Pseudoalteromonas sp. MelDa3]PLT24387.1 hypothetical protein CXF89_15840 [Pseudoalteromonas sp. MelDa3]